MDALTLRDTILQRQASTGLALRFAGSRGDRDPSGFRLARHFSDLADHSDGDLATALAMWIANIEEVRPGAVVLRRPTELDVTAFDGVTAEHAAVLAALVLHRRADAARLARVMGLPDGDATLEGAIADLRRAGLVSGRSSGLLELDRFMAGHTIRWLRAREVL